MKYICSIYVKSLKTLQKKKKKHKKMHDGRWQKFKVKVGALTSIACELAEEGVPCPESLLLLTFG